MEEIARSVLLLFTVVYQCATNLMEGGRRLQELYVGLLRVVCQYATNLKEGGDCKGCITTFYSGVPVCHKFDGGRKLQELYVGLHREVCQCATNLKERGDCKICM
jgi:hypothetical protein